MDYDATWLKIEERKLAKFELEKCEPNTPELLSARQLYNELEKSVKRMARNDRRQYFKAIADDAEKAAANGENRTVYQAIRKLDGGTFKSAPPLKSLDGRTLGTVEQQLERWREHFTYYEQMAPDSPDPEEPA